MQLKLFMCVFPSDKFLKYFIFIAFFISIFTVPLTANASNEPKVPVINILRDPASFLNRNVKVSGSVKYIEPETQSSDSGTFLLEDELKGILKIKTDILPEIGNVVTVTGQILISGNNAEPLFIERKRCMGIDCGSIELKQIIIYSAILIMMVLLLIIIIKIFKTNKSDSSQVQNKKTDFTQDYESSDLHGKKSVLYEKTQDFYGFLKVVKGTIEEGGKSTFDLLNLDSPKGVLVGRVPENDIIIMNRTVSRQHIRIRKNVENKIEIQNVSDSENPVKLIHQNKTIDLNKKESEIVDNGSQVQLGGVTIEFEFPS